MIDKENDIFNAVAKKLREVFPKIYVVGAEIVSAPPRFPSVSFVQTNNVIDNNYSTFNSLENVVKEDYKAEVFSNLEKGKDAQTKEVTSVISDVMCELGYTRTFCEPIANADATISRRVSRYRKNNVI